MKKLLLFTLTIFIGLNFSNAQTALDFDGTNQHVDIGNNIEGLSNMTIETWVYLRSGGVNTNDEIFSKYPVNSLNIWRGGGNKVWFHVGNGTVWFDGGQVVSNNSIPTDTWTHIAVTWEEATTTVNIYINGVLDISASHTHSGGSIMGTSANTRGIAAYPGVSNQNLDGSVDQLRVWNTVRTANEITDNMNLCLTGTEPNLIALYDFEDGTGSSILTDLSPSGFNGTLSNMDPASDWVSGVACSSSLIINEIMYNPPEAGTDSLEFIEIYNNGTAVVNLANYTCTGGNYTFPNSVLAAGAYYLIAVDTIAFNNVYGIPADGQFSNGLSNAGEDIVLKNSFGSLIDSVEYDDITPWPSGATAGNPDGGGSSIILCDENSDNNDGNNWQPSTNSVGVTINGFPVLASPGATNSCASCTPTFGIDPRTECDSLLWTNGITYYADNFTAKDTLVNAAGCDSIVTLDLAVNYSTTGTDVINGCDSLVWLDGNTYFTNNNTATFLTTNLSGCDSLITLNLTMIGNSSASTDVIMACDSITWLDGITYTTSNNSATHIVPNASGCDSVITLDLTVNYSSDVTDTLVACDSLTWIDGNTYTVSNTSAFVLDTTTAGCDSIIRLNLTINQTTEATIGSFSPDSICDNASPIALPLGTPSGGSYSGSGVSGGMFDPSITGLGLQTVVYTFTNASGCTDSVSTDILVMSCVGIDENLAIDKITIYPNPTDKNVTVALGKNYERVSVSILNTLGQEEAYFNYGNTNKVNLELNGGKGIYFVRITLDNKNVITHKVFKK